MHDHDVDHTPGDDAKQCRNVISDYIEMVRGFRAAAADVRWPTPNFPEHNASDFYRSACDALERYRLAYGEDHEYQCLARDLEEANRLVSEADGAH
jgi:hypothetical protein